MNCAGQMQLNYIDRCNLSNVALAAAIGVLSECCSNFGNNASVIDSIIGMVLLVIVQPAYTGCIKDSRWCF